jgi:WD repeat-containing protein 19
VNEFRGDGGAVTRIFPQPVGSKLVFEDDGKNVYMFNPVNDICLPLPQYTGTVENVFWDMADANLFAILDGSQCYTFLYNALSIAGPTIKHLGTFKFSNLSYCRVAVCIDQHCMNSVMAPDASGPAQRLT